MSLHAERAEGVETPILEARDVSRSYQVRGAGRRVVKAVDGVSIALRGAESVGLVGESGSGKSTLGRLLVGLEPPDAGSIVFRGTPLTRLDRTGRSRFRRTVQIVFQDPYASLNPRLTVGSALREVLHVHGLARGEEADRRVAALLGTVGLEASAARRYPHQFSGGQRQRIGIARALAVEPSILIADEPVSALDVSVQAKILGLLDRLRRELGLACLFISHDLAVVRAIAERVAVMRAGRIVEDGPAGAVYDRPEHPYTRSLLEAIPRLPGIS